MARRHQNSINENASSAHDAPFTVSELARLAAMRERYAQGLDLFTAPELERLRFVRWLVQSGRLLA